MVDYNPKDWFIAVFKFHKSDTFRALFWMLVFFVFYSWCIVYIETEYLKLSESSHAKNLTIMHTLLGFAISMLLVFRTNTAYDRWWEGRRLWGALTNNTRNLAMKLDAILPTDDHASRVFFRSCLPLFAKALSAHLHKDSTIHELDTTGVHNLDIKNANHVPNKIAQAIIEKVNFLYVNKKIDGNLLIILNNEVSALNDICGACERIKNTPIPYSYSAFIKKFIFIYVATLPFGFAFSLGYFTLPVTAFIFYVLASLELIAEEIEDPFGKDVNDLPTMKIYENIMSNVEEIVKD
jgi:ion channel-forming bestrophin family protein